MRRLKPNNTGASSIQGADSLRLFYLRARRQLDTGRIAMKILRCGFLLLACAASAAFAQATGARLSGQIRALHRAVRAGRQFRRARAHARAKTRRSARPDFRRRQSAGRRQHGRHRHRRQSDARRLHDHPVGHAAHDQSEHLRQGAVRSGQGLRADHDRRRVADVPVRESGGQGAERQRIHRARESAARQDRRSRPAAPARRRI